ncbi:MAG: HD domain-containing protein [Candidatus Thiodiazotropha sp.]
MIKVDLNQIVIALADALDLVGVDEVAHGKRVGYMAFKCAHDMGRDKTARERLFNIGLLHDCGVSSTREHSKLVTEVQWEGAEAHAREGATLLRTFTPFRDYAEAVRFHHTAWSDLTGMPQLDLRTKLDANLIFMVDRIDARSAAHYGVDLMEKTEEIRAWLGDYAGTLFAPELVELFLQVSASDAFWMMLEPPHLDRFIFDMSQHADSRELALEEIKQLSRIFAYIVDAKSEFTAMHSFGVAHLARHLAQAAGLDRQHMDKIEIAGLLHDIGKLRIPDDVLEKTGPLNETERHAMHRHSFETYQVLRRIDGFNEIALWASYHHETPDGEGYPFRRHGDELSIEARIISVADVFQALAQTRPYRPAMETHAILQHLHEMAANEKLDPRIVALVANDPVACYQAAVSPLEDSALLMLHAHHH